MAPLTVNDIRRPAHYLVAGTCWGVLAYALGLKTFGRAIWGGVFAAPAIGLAVGLLTQPRFEASGGLRRALVALLGLYLGATLFGMAMGLAAVALGTWGENPLEVMLGAVLGVWWGITATGLVLLLWLGALFNYWVLERLEHREFL
jgi:hypothetical protein